MAISLSLLQLGFGRAGAAGQHFRIAFDLAYPTQALIHRVLAGGQLCDPPLVQALTETLQPGDTFLDVGSHIGYLSLLALQNVGPTGSVFAFEPNPHTFQVLLANSLLNRSNNFFAINSAVGSDIGTVHFHINAQDEGMSSALFGPPGVAPITVTLTTLDSFAAIAQIKHIRMLKIDVEGYEENVIAGARQLLASNAIDSIVFEVNNQLPGLPPHRDVPIRQTLASHGFTSYLIKPWLGEPHWQTRCGPHNYTRLPNDAPIDIPYGNILATRHPVAAAES